MVGLTRDDPVFDLDAEIDPYERIRRMLRSASDMRLGDMAMLGSLYQLLSEIGQGRPCASEDPETGYYRKAMWYLEGNYQRDVRVTDVAAFVGLSRSQLFRVFRRAAGMSPKEALNALRAERAAKLLRATDLSLEKVALSAGFFSAGRLNAVFRTRFSRLARPVPALAPAGGRRHAPPAERRMTEAAFALVDRIRGR
jgi:AraC-like DNA-binding protein